VPTNGSAKKLPRFLPDGLFGPTAFALAPTNFPPLGQLSALKYRYWGGQQREPVAQSQPWDSQLVGPLVALPAGVRVGGAVEHGGAKIAPNPYHL